MENSLVDPKCVTANLRSLYRSRLLVSAVSHLGVFNHFLGKPKSLKYLKEKLNLADRPADVLFPSLCAMGVLQYNDEGNLEPTAEGKFLLENSSPNLISYVSLETDDPGAQEMTRRLKNDGPEDTSGGTAYLKEGEGPSPMDDPETARFLTVALSGRAEYLSPLVASKLPKSQGHLLDVAGGTGLYAFEWLLANPQATATVLDTPNVLKVAREYLDKFSESRGTAADSIKSRLTLLAGDMFKTPLPSSDIILAASVLHDWPQETCQVLTNRFATALNSGGELWLHHSFLNDTMDGPLSVTDYSAALFWLTKGRCYSRAEYRVFMKNAGLSPGENSIPTLLDYGLISAAKK